MTSVAGPIALYCPDVPPISGGVSDHTLVLARALEARGRPPVVFARRGDPALFAPLQCISGLRPPALPEAAVRHEIGALVIQYVPFLFARFGVSPALWRAVDALCAAGVTLAIILHEPFVPFTRLPWLVTGFPQRWQLRHLVRRTAHVYTPVPSFAEIARGYARPHTRVQVLPVGANHPVSTVPRAVARRELNIPDDRVVIGVFSPAASGFLVEWIAAAAERLRARTNVMWLLLGFGSDGSAPGLPAGDHVRRLGALDRDRLARAMRAIDIAAAPYADGLTMRRGAAMLLLANGLPLVSSTGQHLDPACARVAACEPDPGAFAARLEQLVLDPAARADWASRAANSADVSSVGPLADAIVRDLTPAARDPLLPAARRL